MKKLSGVLALFPFLISLCNPMSCILLLITSAGNMIKEEVIPIQVSNSWVKKSGNLIDKLI